MIPEIRRCCYASALLIITLLSGCGSGDKLQRQGIRGDVTLDGAPLQKGAITFIPIGQGNSVGATIAEGKYLIDSKNGAGVGEYRVEIDSSQPSGKKVQSTIGENLEEEYINIIPENYNRKTILKVTIKQDGDNNHSFELKSKP